MRKLFTVCFLLAVATAVSFGQTYKFVDKGPFPNDTTPKWVINNGLAVDPEGKVWIQSYGGATDSFPGSPGYWSGVIRVYNPNGTEAAISPIKILTGLDETGATVTDTLNGSGYGMSVNRKNGNILSVKWSYRVWEINYKTGQGVRRRHGPIKNASQAPQSIAGVDANSDGELFLCAVLPDLPATTLGTDFTDGTPIATSIGGYGRDIAVSANGNDVFVPRFSLLKTYVYHSANGSLGPYALADSFGLGASTETIKLSPKTGYVWFDADNRSTRDTIHGYAWSKCWYYAYDPVTKTLKDSVRVFPDSIAHPRGLAFSPSGDTMYVGHFFNLTVPVVRRFVWESVVSVERVENAVPDGFNLAQNFPNPFNPTTEIQFSVGTRGLVTLRVYDMLGREVQTLVNESLDPGVYTTTFDAGKLTTGAYVYVLTANDVRISKKMLLAK